MAATTTSPTGSTAQLSRPSFCQENVPQLQARPPLSGAVLPPITVMESNTGFRILVPVGEVNLRHVWIFATPNSISVEIRSRNTVEHISSFCREIDEQRILRELKLPAHIIEGSTSVRPIGTDLEISCTKEPDQSDRHWAEMLRFDTRTSLGCI